MFLGTSDICCAVIAILLSIKKHVHVMDDSNNEIRVKRDAGRDEKQLIKFAWPNVNQIKSNMHAALVLTKQS